MDTLPPISTAEFLNRLGVNVHLEYTDGKYAYVNNVIENLRYLGISRVRDGTLSPENGGQHSYGVAAKAGVKFNLIIGGGKKVEERLSLVHKFAMDFPGSVAALEGPNEVNNWPVSYNGITGDAGAIAFQAALYDGIKADPILKETPVYNVTSWPDLAGKADFANFHSYPHRGDQPRKTLTDNFSTQARVMPGKPMVLTETGYYTLPNSAGWGGVDQPSQAKMILNLILDAVKLGIEDIYLYELLDAYPDPKNNNQEAHFGLFDYDNKPKAAATAIHNLTSILKNGGDAASKPAASKLAYTLEGLPPTGDSLVLQKAPDVHDIMVWNEPDIWNENTYMPIAIAPKPVTLRLAQPARISVYDPLAGKEAIKQASGAQIQLELADHPLIIEVSPL